MICAYLDEAYPGHPLLPAGPKDRARARWLEEYADTRRGDVFIWGLFYQLAVHPAVWGEPGDAARVERTRGEAAPAVLDYLETQAPAQGTYFRNAGFVQDRIDAGRLPRTAAYVARVLEHPCLKSLQPFEDIQLSATIKGRRQALLDAGAPLVAESVGGREPRKGVMTL